MTTSLSQKPVSSATHVRIKDVAKRAKVAPSTVSLALSGNGYISDEKREHILRVANEMNYRPKMAARLLRAHTTGYMGLIVNAYSQDAKRSGDQAMDFRPVGWQITSFLEACRNDGLRHQIEVIQPPSDEHKGVSELIEGGMIDGAVISGLVEKDCPLGNMLREKPQFPWVSLDEPSEYCVLSATDQGVEQAMQYLAALGHQKIAVTFGDVNCLQHAQVKQGYEAAVKQFGLKTQAKWMAPFPGSINEKLREKETRWARNILTSKNRPTAIFCGGIGTAAIVIHTAVQLGIDVPSELSVIAVGFGVDASSQAIVPTMLERDHKSMMTAALSMLRARLQDRSVEEPVQRFVPNLIHGQSVARVHD
ncbi:MAG: LacI family DNA-binding transcriptional regulator [Phycisphaeraceae bacterium JB051]